MTLSAGPHAPRKGWFLRWSKQSLQLMARSADAALALGLGLVLICVLTLPVFIAGYFFLPLDSLIVVIKLIMLPMSVLLFATIQNMVMHNDMGFSNSWRDAVARSAILIPPTLLFYGFIVLTIHFATMLSPADTDAVKDGVEKVRALPDLNLTVLLLHVPIQEAFTALLFLGFIHPFSVPAAIGTRLSLAEIKINDNLLAKKSRGIGLAYYGLVLIVTFVASLMPVLVSMGILYFSIVFHYVGGREVVGGIDGNGVGRAAAVPTALPAV